MRGERHRYFLEVRDSEQEQIPRDQEIEHRRRQALEAITIIEAWLRNEDLQDKVSAMTVTALGQVHITCEAEVLSGILNEESLPVTSVRYGAMFFGNLGHLPIGSRIAGCR